MITSNNSEAIATLEDGRICCWSYLPPDRPHLTDWEPMRKLELFDDRDVFFAITESGKVLMGLMIDGAWNLTDYTPTLCDILQTERVDDLDLIVRFGCVCIRTTDRVVIICLPLGFRMSTELAVMATYQFTSAIDIFEFGRYWAIVRTVDGCLYSAGDIQYTETDHTGHMTTHMVKGDSVPRPINFSEAGRITKIISRNHFTLFLTDDGQVFALNIKCKPDGSYDADNIERVEFPDDDRIDKIINDDKEIYYVSASGRCYQAGASMILRPSWENGPLFPDIYHDRGLKPELIKTLAGLFVEDIYILNTVIIVRYSGSKFGILDREIIPKTRTWLIDDAYIRGEIDLRTISNFDDKNIAIFYQCGLCALAVTDDGLVYYVKGAVGHDWSEVYRPLVPVPMSTMPDRDIKGCTLIPFFIENRCRVKYLTPHVSSARSIMRH